MDVAYGERYVDEIAAALQRVDPANAADYAAGAAAYRARLSALDASVRQKIATIPEANRRIVTFHDAFPYYARAYGITIVGDGGRGARAGPDRGLHRAAHRRDQGVRGQGDLLARASSRPKLVDQLAAETGVTVVANLYDDSIGDPPADCYEGVIAWDTDQLVAALR